MADPTNPAGAGGPPSGGPPGGNPPLDPGTANVLEKMTTMLREQAVLTAENTKNLRESTDAFKQHLKLSEDINATYNKTVKLGKKLKRQNLEEFRDTQKTRKELEEIAKLYENALNSEKASAKEIKVMTKNLGEVKKLLRDVGTSGQVTEDQFKRMSNVIGDMAHNA